MSVVVTGTFPGDTDAFRRYIESGADVMRKISEDAKSKGAIHHRFAVGDGFVLLVDEWESAEAFQSFFQSNPDIPTVMQEAGARGEPQFTIAEAVETADQF